MFDLPPVGLTLLLIAVVVYLTRLCGYLLGQRIRHIHWIRPVLEVLPGCAMMALIVPAVYRGGLVELVALCVVVAIMWWWNNVILATGTGLAVLLLAQPLATLVNSGL